MMMTRSVESSRSAKATAIATAVGRRNAAARPDRRAAIQTSPEVLLEFPLLPPAEAAATARRILKAALVPSAIRTAPTSAGDASAARNRWSEADLGGGAQRPERGSPAAWEKEREVKRKGSVQENMWKKGSYLEEKKCKIETWHIKSRSNSHSGISNISSNYNYINYNRHSSSSSISSSRSSSSGTRSRK